jgi:Flp pilus assembly secretin CpaC
MSKSDKKKLQSAKSGKIARAAIMALSLAAVTGVISAKAIAASQLTVIADRAKIVRIAGEISSIVVGNPAFADVSVQKKFIIVHGRNFGQTNILVLDDEGNALADLEVTIVKGPDRNVSVYRAGQKASYACAPKCESTLQVGDSEGYFKVVNESISTKMNLAQNAGKLTTK